MRTGIALAGAHVRLRELRAADVAAHRRIHTHPVLTRYLGVERMTPEAADRAFEATLLRSEERPRRRHVFAVTGRDDDTMAGCVGLLVEDYGRNAMLTGLVVLPDGAARGHGTEAGRLVMAYGFGPLGMHRIWAGHRHDHRRMRDVMLAGDMHPEATLRELFHTQGAWHDVVTYAALAPRWRLTARPHERAILDLADDADTVRSDMGPLTAPVPLAEVALAGS
ncbi:GNAT family N-acetyltransferase [Streptomyces spiramenti]|uniref:GNAT family N-acetyltransferase n=1 Tax=Streptomyces spiramenti TaxID=2720606 RepID=A0ABX1AL83_9ACTN|nr:GNAT family protein [Streptomyces spiramenti]NJP66461.1 GNAT family N-acetyltransferase [Streptomyces spiramenti]